MLGFNIDAPTCFSISMNFHYYYSMKKLLMHYCCIFLKKKYLFIYLFSLILTSCGNNPRIHIDNYSGMNVKIDLDNKHWIDVEHSSTIHINSLGDKPKKIRPGKHLITIKTNNDEVEFFLVLNIIIFI